MHLGFLFVVTFTFILLLSSIFVYFFNKKIGIFVPLSFMIVALTYYFVGLIFGSFEYVKYLLIIYAIIGLVCFIMCIRKNKTKLILSYGLLFFFVIYVYFFIYCFKYRISFFDEYSAWSPMVRTMFINNKFYSACTGGGTHIEYPPFFSLIEYFFCKIYGSFSESVLSIALHISAFSFFVVPYIDAFNLNLKKSFYLLVFVLMTAIFFNYNFRSILVDTPLPFVASFPIILLISGLVNNRFGVLYYAISLACLLLIKQSSIGFYVFNIVLFCIKTYKSKEKKSFSIDLFIIIFIPLIIYYSWMKYIYYLGVGGVGQFSIVTMISKFSLFDFSEMQIEMLKNIGLKILIGDMIKGKMYLSCFIFYIIIFILYIAFGKINKVDNRNYIFYNLFCILIYYIFILFVYCFGMEENEMLTLNAFFRYTSSFNIYLSLVFMLLNRQFFKPIFELIIILIMLIINISNFHLLLPKILINGTVDDGPSQSLIDSSDYINTLLDEEDKILIVSDYNFIEFKLDYLTMYTKHFHFSDYFNERAYDIDSLNNGNLIKEIKNYDYVIFSFNNSDTYVKVEDYFKNYYDGNSIFNDVLYKVLDGNNMFHMMP